ncbi:MAG: OFA family MFS transporter, partial [Halobacteria archaeon]|nr:OFA family MFS transporter [Halobacteria archaeon]
FSDSGPNNFECFNLFVGSSLEYTGMSGERLSFSRWWLVVVAALAIGVAGTYQFVWSTFRPPLGQRLGASGASLGTVFTLFIIFQTASQFPVGWFRDRWGPRIPLLVASLLMFVGYAGTAFAGSLWQVYLFYSLGGIGAGTAYTVAVNTPVKWFSERRGLATGVVTMAYGGASFAVIPYVRRGISSDFSGTVLVLGILAGLGALVAVPVLRDPSLDIDVNENGDESVNGGYTWRGSVRTWQFWLLYVVFIVVNGVGLMLIGKSVSFAQGLGLSDATATASASLIALADGAGVLIVGGVSDRLGRETTTGATLLLCGASLFGAVMVGGIGMEVAFVALVGAAAFFRSPVFSIFPSVVGDYYGEAHSSENYALLYTAKVWGGVFGGTVTSLLIASMGWSNSFFLGAALLVLSGLASFFLRPP